MSKDPTWPLGQCLQHGRPGTCPSLGRTEDGVLWGVSTALTTEGSTGKASSPLPSSAGEHACTWLQGSCHWPLAYSLRLLGVWSSGVSLLGPTLCDTPGYLVESPASKTEVQTPGTHTSTAVFIWSPMWAAIVKDVRAATALGFRAQGC